VGENFEALEKCMFLVDGFRFGASGGVSEALGGWTVRGGRVLRGVGPWKVLEGLNGGGDGIGEGGRERGAKRRGGFNGMD